jgi:hypothetical protein
MDRDLRPVVNGLGAQRVTASVPPSSAGGEQIAREKSEGDHAQFTVENKGRSTMLILIILLVLLLGGGGGYYGHSRWGYGGGAGVGLGTILLILLLVYMLGIIH